jgi:hypothetical protein
MNINITLIVQAINFYIAYKLITKLLLKPAFAILMDEEKQQADLRYDVIAQQGKLANLHKKKKEQWVLFQRNFKSKKPVVAGPDDTVEFAYSMKIVDNLTERHVEHIAQELAQDLTGKVMHG